MQRKSVFCFVKAIPRRVIKRLCNALAPDDKQPALKDEPVKLKQNVDAYQKIER